MKTGETVKRLSTRDDDPRVLPSAPMDRDQRKAAEVVADHLRRDIATGTLSEGDSLPPEGELIAHYGVSRPTLRTAFRILESESLLTIAKGAQGGARVRHPDAGVTARNMGLLLHLRGARISDFYQARAAIEPEAAYLFAERQPAEGFEVLEEMVEVEAALDHRFAASSHAYYRAITDHCGNEVFSVFGSVVQVLIGNIGAFLLKTKPAPGVESFAQSVADHRQLLKLLKRGDAAQAQRFWKKHIEWTAQIYPEFLPLPFSLVTSELESDSAWTTAGPIDAVSNKR